MFCFNSVLFRLFLLFFSFSLSSTKTCNEDIERGFSFFFFSTYALARNFHMPGLSGSKSSDYVIICFAGQADKRTSGQAKGGGRERERVCVDADKWVARTKWSCFCWLKMKSKVKWSGTTTNVLIKSVIIYF